MKAVLFDLDGTLIDTAADFIRIIQQMCREENRIVIPAEIIRSQVSEGAAAMVQLVYPELAQNDPTLLAHRQRFLDLYAANIAIDTTLFPGMSSLLAELEHQSIPWGIVTNKPRQLTERLLHALNLSSRCAVLVCPEDVSKTKPDPEPMLLAAQQLDLAAQQCIYIGDHPRDIDAGRSAHMFTILAAYGYLPLQHKDDLTAWHADCIVHNVTELHHKISSLITSV
ncbi:MULTISPECIES: HAD-IA family hydrolase [unclassified Acinetobacter]|uniref:HAD family hydrolase n=1 Tax=unclassified Acinetobacter TaxID=196816 RepID=UPI002934CC60|nr:MULTISPECIES: HAD-IA family hydrolase [unclassified Acinetobacter]WOE33158.1 HAD-IA family hydrolase [Acinetobacter sp. SAAs470]WOE39820.1 HAD-IA family hydrolase [Acinetobacter sp. SAAs474]